MAAASPALPPELLLEVCRHLDPATAQGRGALAALLRVSRAVWALAASVLYASLRLDSLRLRLLLGAGCALGAARAAFLDIERYHGLRGRADFAARFGPVVLGERTRRALRYVRALTLLAPLDSLDILLLWLAIRPGEPLFPGVRRVTLAEDPALRGAHVPEAPGECAPGCLLFDAPDACLDDEWRQLCLLPARRWRSITFHGMMPFFRYGEMPSPWAGFRIFARTNEYAAHKHRTDDLARTLEACDPQRNLSAVEIHMRDYDREDRPRKREDGAEEDGVDGGEEDDETLDDDEEEADEDVDDSEEEDDDDEEGDDNDDDEEDGENDLDEDNTGDGREDPDDENDEPGPPIASGDTAGAEGARHWNNHLTLDDLLAGTRDLGPRFRVMVTRLGDEAPLPCAVCQKTWG